MKREFSVNNEVLAPYYRKASGLTRYFKKVELMHTIREYNQEVDALAK